MNQGKIYNLVKNKKQFLISKEYNSKIIVVDFFNVYCFVTKFNKYKTFSNETFMMTMNFISRKFKDNELFVVSKGVFEVGEEELLNLTRKHLNLTYIVCEDNHSIKSLNRERDDYGALILLKEFDRKKSLFISNDKMRNFKSILKCVKPLTMHFYKNGLKNSFEISKKDIEKNEVSLLNFGKPNLANFKFV